MHKTVSILVIAIIAIMSFQLQAQYAKNDTTFRRYFVGSTLFMLGNLDTKNKPDFVQLNIGYRLSGRDVFSLELKTWKYTWSLGI